MSYPFSDVLGKAKRRVVRWRAKRAIARIDNIAHGAASAADKFTAIYKERLWLVVGAVNGERESLSGHGSSLRSTSVIRGELEALFADQPPRAFFDAPCGDFNWMKAVRFPLRTHYIGGDIVAPVVAGNEARYARPATTETGGREFINFDITRDAFPEADYWFCKDCLQHLSLADVEMALRNFARSNIATALISNHHGITQNTDIPTGEFRHLDLTLPPFNLPPPQRILRDSPIDAEPRIVAMWTIEEIRQAMRSI